MKKQIAFLILSFIFAWWAASASAAEVTIAWNPVDFAVCGSDPAKSGYKIYKSPDDGVTKALAGQVAVDIVTLQVSETKAGKWCYYATAFNQLGESKYSDPACAYIATSTPPGPTGLDAIVKALQEISATLKDIAVGIMAEGTGR